MEPQICRAKLSISSDLPTAKETTDARFRDYLSSASTQRQRVEAQRMRTHKQGTHRERAIGKQRHVCFLIASAWMSKTVEIH